MSSNNNQPLVLRKDQEGITTLTLHRPTQYNALSMNMLVAILKHLEAIETDKSVRVVILAAAGKAFCSGHDLKEMHANRDKTFGDALFAKCSEMMLKIRQLRQPVIAKVHGIATAAGCQLVATCDLAIAAKEVRFATSGINYGLFCSTPAVALSRTMHSKKALEMLLTGNFINATEAKAEGLINRVVNKEELDEATWELATTIACKATDALKIGKEMFYKQLAMDLPDAYQYASEKIVCNFLEDDAKEGLDAFAEKRKPKWQG